SWQQVDSTSAWPTSAPEAGLTVQALVKPPWRSALLFSVDARWRSATIVGASRHAAGNAADTLSVIIAVNAVAVGVARRGIAGAVPGIAVTGGVPVVIGLVSVAVGIPVPVGVGPRRTGNCKSHTRRHGSACHTSADAISHLGD